VGELAAPGPAIAVTVTGEAPGVTTLGLRGEVDIATVGVLDQAIADALRREGVTTVVLDLSELSFMDSSGLGALLRATSRGARIELRNVSALIREVVAATGLVETLHLEADP
jgi:anti-sigma B factor antagonist